MLYYHELSQNRWFNTFLCFVAGASCVLGFAPFYLAWLPVAGLALLFFSWCNADSAKQAFQLGFAFGLGFFLFGVSWVYVSLSTYGGMPLWMGSIAVLGFASLLALFMAIPGLLIIVLCRKKGTVRLLLIPPVWIVFEWLRSWVLTGFPWLELGYSQTETWLFALAPVGGVYLVSFATLTIACCLTLLFCRPSFKPTVLILGVIAGSWMLERVEWTHSEGEELSIGLVQANVPISEKWLANKRIGVVQQYVSMTRALEEKEPLDLAVWPETALPVFYQQTDAAFWEAVKPQGVALLTGLLDQPTPQNSYNAAILLCGENHTLYRKRHLVPFGEYLPLRFLFNWVLEYLQLPMSDFSAWKGQQTLQCEQKNLNLSLSICYEDAFASEWRRQVGDASLLVNISEDAWFGDSLAPHQRMQMAQMRAREHGRPLVRSANTGPSVFINERGEVVAKTEQFKAASIQANIQPKYGRTPYQTFGNWIVYLSLILLFVKIMMKRIGGGTPSAV